MYCSITGFGAGEGARLPGYDLLVQALGGLMSITGSPDGEPQKVGVALVDILAGLFASVGILAALRHRDATGEGQRVEVDLLSSLLAALVNQASAFTLAGVVPGRMGNAHPSISPYELYPAAEGELVLAVGNDRQFTALCEVLGAPELADDERFRGNAHRVQNRVALREDARACWQRARQPTGRPRSPTRACPPASSTTCAARSSWRPRWGWSRSSTSRRRRLDRAADPQPDPPLAHAAGLSQRAARRCPSLNSSRVSRGSAASIAVTIFGSSGVTLVAHRAISLPSAPTRYLVKFHTGGPDSGWRARSDHSGDGSARTDVRSVNGKLTP